MTNSTTLEGLIDRLPPISQAALKAMDALNAPRADMASITTLLGPDPALTMQILHVANSPFYGLARRILDLRKACTVIGLFALRGILQAAIAAQAFPVDKKDGALAALWAHSAHVALLARRLANTWGLDAETAFTAGLLHDIGALALESLMPTAADAVREMCAEDAACLRIAAERCVLGFDHAQAGGAIAQRWHLPEVIAQTIEHHACPDGATPLPYADLVHLSSHLSRAMVLELPSSVVLTQIDSSVVRRLELTEERLAIWLTTLPPPSAGSDVKEMLGAG